MDYQAKLKAAQASVKALGSQRDKLIGDARVEEARVKQTVEQLTALGVENAADLTVEQLQKLREKSEVELEENLNTLTEQITAAEAVMAEYEGATA